MIILQKPGTGIDPLPDGWAPLDRPEASQMEKELKRETCAQHPLSGLEGRCVAWREGFDDFAFIFPSLSTPVAVVHLT